MPLGPYCPREPGSLKEAESALVQACGGLPGAAKLLYGRVRQAQIARYTSETEECEFVHMPADVIATLEAACGAPIVTRWLAMAARALLVPLPGRGQETSYLESLGRIGENSGELFRRITGALEDGVVTPREAGEVKAEAMKLSAALGVLIGRLNRAIDGEAAR